MPRKNEKQKILEFLIADAADRIFWLEENDSDDDEFDEIMDELMEDVLIVASYRRTIEAYLKKPPTDCRENILASFNDERFREMLRVDRSQFARLIEIITDDSEFQRKHVSIQIPIELQLAIVLYRLGTSGKNASMRNISKTFGIGDGGTILKITQRIFRIFLKLMPKYIFWPNSAERCKIVETTYEELPHCIGYIAGAEMKLAETPLTHPELYFSKNYNFCIKAQIVCDHDLQIRNLVVGSPGSHCDADVFEKCKIFQQKENHFTSNQWLAGGSSYYLSDVIITPYGTNSEQHDLARRKRFNMRLNRYRVRAERCFSMLTEKFCSLKQLRVRLKSKQSHKYLCEWVTVCCILHNILITESEIENFADSLDKAQDEPAVQINEDSALYKQLERKRQSLYHLMFP